jgi:hypothetical protein
MRVEKRPCPPAGAALLEFVLTAGCWTKVHSGSQTVLQAFPRVLWLMFVLLALVAPFPFEAAPMQMQSRKISQNPQILDFNFHRDWWLNEPVLIFRIGRRSPGLCKKFGNLVAIFFEPPTAKHVFLIDMFCLFLAEKCSDHLHAPDLTTFQKRFCGK